MSMHKITQLTKEEREHMEQIEHEFASVQERAERADERSAIHELIWAIQWIVEVWDNKELAQAVNYARQTADAIAEKYPLEVD
jgi:uncharacterized membrane protein